MKNWKYGFMLLWLIILAYLISLMSDVCNSNTLPTESATDENNNNQNFTNSDNTFDYTEDFEPNESSDIVDTSAPIEEVANQNVKFTPALDNSDSLLAGLKKRKLPKDEEEELVVDGTDALIAASSDRFYSIDTKGQTNRNASNDLRGDLPIAYNENYTPFNQSAIYGEPLVAAGRL